MSPLEWVRLLIEAGPELRAAGVNYISAGGCSANLEPLAKPEPEPAQVIEQWQREPVEVPRSPLDDPATFGIQAPRGRAPSYRRPEDENED